jgi:transcriptional regulator with XRE-family HTH domain
MDMAAATGCATRRPGTGDAMTFGEKLKRLREDAGLTQARLADKLSVSRQAVTKWESDKGLPDIENLKRLSALLDTSVDSLLDGSDALHLVLTRETIDLAAYPENRAFRGPFGGTISRKDAAVRSKFPGATIHYLGARQLPTKEEQRVDAFLDFFSDVPGVSGVVNGLKNAGKAFYLVDDGGRQFLACVTDDVIETRRMDEKVSSKTFRVDGFEFILGVAVP